MSTRRHSKISRAKRERGPNGRFLCTWCRTEVKPPRITFCSDECVHQWKIRSDAGYAAGLVYERDAGICAICGVDTVEERHRAHVELKGSPWADRSALLASWKSKGWPDPLDRVWYDIDHIVPVCEGGGECGLDNLRTACVPCHKKLTRELAAKRKANRKK
jgi:5-methylcytosine-specific restriction endonuclease McrA